MKIVIFGGSGFLGSHVADILSERGHKITVFDLNKSPYLKDGQAMVAGNILDREAVNSVLKGVDIAYNFAGISDIKQAKLEPVETIKQNVLGNMLILDSCRNNRIKRFLFASSIYVYSDSGSFYRSSKEASEEIINDYHKAFGIDFTIMRYGSLYGPRASSNNWINRILKQAVSEGKIIRDGDGEEIREYIHVRDAARISADLLDEQYKNEHVIISGMQPIKIKDLLIMVKEILKDKVDIEYSQLRNEEHYEITPYSFNPRAAKKIFSNSYYDLGQGILDLLDKTYKEHKE